MKGKFALIAVLSSVVFSAGCLHLKGPICVVPASIKAATPAPEPTPAPEETPVSAAVEPTPAPAPVVEAPAPPAPAPAPVVTAAEFYASVHDIFFDFDKSTIRPDQLATLNANIAFLRANPTVKYEIIGTADTRGTGAYNLALGQSRVDAVHLALIATGVDGPTRATASTNGKTAAYCSVPSHAEACYSLNRRVHFVFVSN